MGSGRDGGRAWRFLSSIFTAYATVGALLAMALVIVLIRAIPHGQSQLRLVATLTSPGGPPGDGDGAQAVFSPDGRTLATNDGNSSIYLWDVATRSRIARVRDPGTGVDALAFSPDGRTLAVADADGRTYLLTAPAGHLITAFKDPAGKAAWPVSLAFSPYGTTLATADAGGRTYLWNVATGRLTATLTDPGDTSLLRSIAFAPDGTTLAAADDSGTVYLWNVATGRLTATLTDHANIPGEVSVVAFSPDGRTVAVGGIDVDPDDGGSDIDLWNVATGRLIGRLYDSLGPVDSVAFAPDGRTLADADNSGTIYLWNVALQRVVVTVSVPGGRSVSSLAFAPEDTTLAAAVGNITYLYAEARKNVAGPTGRDQRVR